MSNAEELERLVREAGFLDVRRQTQTGTARFPAPEKFVEWQVAASPLATLGGLSDEAFTAVRQDVSAALRPYVGADGCAFPMAAHLLTDYRKLLDRKDIEVVTIVTPDHWHSRHAIDAMNAGVPFVCATSVGLVPYGASP